MTQPTNSRQASMLRTARRTFKRWTFQNGFLRRPLVALRHMGLGSTDVLLATYPRSGTTWLRFMLYECLSGEEGDFKILRDAIPYLGDQSKAARLLPSGGRIIQTHEPHCDRERKVIHLVRDPRSVAVSQFHWYTRGGRTKAPNLDSFVKEWVKGEGIPFDSWGGHTRFWLDWGSKHPESLHLMRYEDLKSAPNNALKNVLGFLGLQPQETRVESAVQHNSVANMRAKEEKGSRMPIPDDPQHRFVRAGTGSWREELSADSEQLIIRSFRFEMNQLSYGD